MSAKSVATISSPMGPGGKGGREEAPQPHSVCSSNSGTPLLRDTVPLPVVALLPPQPADSAALSLGVPVRNWPASETQSPPPPHLYQCSPPGRSTPCRRCRGGPAAGKCAAGRQTGRAGRLRHKGGQGHRCARPSAGKTIGGLFRLAAATAQGGHISGPGHPTPLAPLRTDNHHVAGGADVQQRGLLEQCIPAQAPRRQGGP